MRRRVKNLSREWSCPKRRRYRSIAREGMTKAQAKARYAEDVAKAQAAKEEEERLAKQKEDEEKAEAEAKASANTRLLEEIRDSLKELAAKR